MNYKPVYMYIDQLNGGLKFTSRKLVVIFVFGKKQLGKYANWNNFKHKQNWCY